MLHNVGISRAINDDLLHAVWGWLAHQSIQTMRAVPKDLLWCLEVGFVLLHSTTRRVCDTSQLIGHWCSHSWVMRSEHLPHCSQMPCMCLSALPSFLMCSPFHKYVELMLALWRPWLWQVSVHCTGEVVSRTVIEIVNHAKGRADLTQLYITWNPLHHLGLVQVVMLAINLWHASSCSRCSYFATCNEWASWRLQI